jgi:hypothetical protein
MTTLQIQLSLPEAVRLNELEAVIERGRQTFIEVGQALRAIRDERLYRAEYSTFEDYCRERWLMAHAFAYYLIAAAQVVSTIVDTPNPPIILPSTESQARELAPLRAEPEIMREVWQEAVERAQGQPTAAVVREVREELKSVAHVSYNSGNNEWYTPSEWIAAARLVLGEIDLDPASTPAANEIVGARHFLTAQDDGLKHPWFGNLWMNPPYAGELISLFTAKMGEHYGRGDVKASITLVNNATETSWFQDLARHASAICFPSRRIRFWGPNGEVGAPLQGQALLYLGSKTVAFYEAFQAFGLVVRPS